RGWAVRSVAAAILRTARLSQTYRSHRRGSSCTLLSKLNFGLRFWRRGRKDNSLSSWSGKGLEAVSFSNRRVLFCDHHDRPLHDVRVIAAPGYLPLTGN